MDFMGFAPLKADPAPCSGCGRPTHLILDAGPEDRSEWRWICETCRVLLREYPRPIRSWEP